VARDRSASAVSALLLDELFSSQDPHFVPTLRRSTDSKQLQTYIERWKTDPRPWAREQLLIYLEGPLDALADRPISKRWFKHAESQRDDELLAAFTVAFDRFVRRKRQTRYHYDWRTRGGWSEEVLRSPYATGGFFSNHTRYYLRRRAWRYFRRMGFQQPGKYCPAIAAALRPYRDDDFARGENILDSWSLLHACFRGSDVLHFGASHVNLKPGRDLGELAPAPYFLKLWQESSAVPILLSLVEDARSRLVRVWAIGLLRRQHGRQLAGVDVDRILRLLDHADDEVQQFGAELLHGLEGLDRLPIETWIKLLATRNLTALATVADLMRRHVPADRITLSAAVDLAIAKPAPVARIGMEYLRSKPIRSREDAAHIARAASANSAAVAGELTTWALAILGTDPLYNVDHVGGFFDSLLRASRDAAWTWLLDGSHPLPRYSGGGLGRGPDVETSHAPSSNASRAYSDPILWSRLLETPFDDSQLKLVEALQQRASLPGQGGDRLAPLWASVLLNVHRGGRHKLTALRQIAGALVEDPMRAELLLSVLAVALRSVRAPEARAGLAALVRLADARPDVLPLIERHLPEVQLVGEVEACS
jgi:hypothetical protein